MASMNRSTMGTISHGLAPSSSESVSRLKLTRTSRLYSSQFIQNSDCSLVHRIPTRGLASGHSGKRLTTDTLVVESLLSVERLAALHRRLAVFRRPFVRIHSSFILIQRRKKCLFATLDWGANRDTRSTGQETRQIRFPEIPLDIDGGRKIVTFAKKQTIFVLMSGAVISDGRQTLAESEIWPTKSGPLHLLLAPNASR